MTGPAQIGLDLGEIAATGLRARVLGRDRLVGTFVKSRAHQSVEILGLAGLDFVILDAEHAPVDHDVIDRAVLAGAATGIAVLIRVPGGSPDLAAAALDLGAAGIVFPHVGNAAQARDAVARVRFSAGLRGISPSVRAAGYGAMAPKAFARVSDAAVTVWVQIEDADGLRAMDEIAEVAGIDALFVGRVDLAASLGLDAESEAITRETDRILRTAATAGLGGAVFSPHAEDAAARLEQGASIVVVASDQAFLRSAALEVVRSLRV